MSDSWRNVNDMYYVPGNNNQDKSEAKPVEIDEGPAPEQQDGPEVRLVQGTWAEGQDGFQFNKKCIAKVKLEFLKETSQKKIQLQTFVEYNGEKEDLGQTVDAYANDEGVAEAEIMLYYGEKFCSALEKDPALKCNYSFIANHSKATGELESEPLEMPFEENTKTYSLAFIDEFGNALETDPFEVKFFTDDGEEEIVQTDNTGVATCDISEDANEVKAVLTENSLDSLRNSLKDKWNETYYNKNNDKEIITKDEDTFIEGLKETILNSEYNLSDGKEKRVCIKPYSFYARMMGFYFDTNKCFLLPEAMKNIKEIVQLYNEHPNSKLLVIGHTDKSGDPDYNDILSLERADAVAAFLKDDVESWLAWYGDDKSSSKKWGQPEDNYMLDTLINVNDIGGSGSKIRRFQEWYNQNGGGEELAVDGAIGPVTRKALITKYMEQDGTTLPDDIELETHGCGENFPLDPEDKDDENAGDRRVELFFFDKVLGIQPPPSGSNSAPGSLEYPEWCARSNDIDFSADGKNALHIHFYEGEENPAPKGTSYKVKINGVEREGVIDNDEGLAIETGLEVEDNDSVDIEWGQSVGFEMESQF